MERTEQELYQAVESLWNAQLYKVVLSNVRKNASGAVQQDQKAVQSVEKKNPQEAVRQYRKIVLNRLKTCWQAEKYTEKQVFHENLPEDSAEAYLL